jgi:hypothetical protein
MPGPLASASRLQKVPDEPPRSIKGNTSPALWWLCTGETLKSLRSPFPAPVYHAKALTMASSQAEEFVIPRGYVKQELSDVTTKYIKGEVLQRWLRKHKHIFGSRCAFIVS